MPTISDNTFTQPQAAEAKRAAGAGGNFAAGVVAAAALVLIVVPEARAARCAFPHEYYRPRLGTCEAKAGGAFYRRHVRLAVNKSAQKPKRRTRPSIAALKARPAATQQVDPKPQGSAEGLPASFEERWWIR